MSYGVGSALHKKGERSAIPPAPDELATRTRQVANSPSLHNPLGAKSFCQAKSEFATSPPCRHPPRVSRSVVYCAKPRRVEESFRVTASARGRALLRRLPEEQPDVAVPLKLRLPLLHRYEERLGLLLERLQFL